MTKLSLKVDIKKKLKLFELDIDTVIQPGVLGILGPSGCGKSMTLKSIAGIVTPDSGSIVLQGGRGGDRVLYDSAAKVNVRPQKRRIGYLFQNYALFPNMTVTQNILAGLGGKNTGNKAEEMIHRFHLEGLERQYPRQLSGGQQQRVALARILAYEPEVLLLDEPFSAMDTFLREQLRMELGRVLKEYEGISIMVTHDRDEAYQLCDNLILVHDGKILAAGGTKDIFEDPGSCSAARLTGCKNISRIQRVDDHHVKALDWSGLVFATEHPVTDGITHMGIRAHDFEPVSASRIGGDGVNLIPVKEPEVSEMPFEWYITLDNGLWWKREKDIHCHNDAGVIPDYLRIDPKAILLLKED